VTQAKKIVLENKSLALLSHFQRQKSEKIILHPSENQSNGCGSRIIYSDPAPALDPTFQGISDPA